MEICDRSGMNIFYYQILVVREVNYETLTTHITDTPKSAVSVIFLLRTRSLALLYQFTQLHCIVIQRFKNTELPARYLFCPYELKKRRFWYVLLLQTAI